MRSWCHQAPGNSHFLLFSSWNVASHRSRLWVIRDFKSKRERILIFREKKKPNRLKPKSLQREPRVKGIEQHLSLKDTVVLRSGEDLLKKNVVWCTSFGWFWFYHWVDHSVSLECVGMGSLARILWKKEQCKAIWRHPCLVWLLSGFSWKTLPLHAFFLISKFLLITQYPFLELESLGSNLSSICLYVQLASQTLSPEKERTTSCSSLNPLYPSQYLAPRGFSTNTWWMSN